jgi:hypothetical protein
MLEKMIDETPEAVFFRYSADCAYHLFSLGRIKKEQYIRILKCREKREVPDRAFLEAVYPAAMERIKRLAETLGKNHWDVEVIRKYFLEEHNKVIDRGEGYYATAPNALKELCKVRMGIVKAKDKRNTYRVDFGDREEVVVGKYVPNVGVGDRISTHWKVAIEIIR